MFQDNDSGIRQLEKTRNEYTGLVDSIATTYNNMKPTNKEPTYVTSTSKASQSQTNRGVPQELQGLDECESVYDAPRHSSPHSMLRNSSKKKTTNCLKNDLNFLSSLHTKGHLSAFKKWDKDNDGYIDRDEFVKAVATEMDLCSADEARRLFCSMDKSGKNSLNFREFHNNFKYGEGETLLQEAH